MNIKNYKKHRTLGIPLILAFGLTHCVSHKYEPKLPVVAEDTSLEMLSDLLDLYPPEFKMVHRVIIKIHGREFDFNGYFLMRRPDILHAAAYAEAGGAIFEFKNGGDKAVVLAKPAILDEEPLIGGVIQDLLHIYRKPNKAKASLVEKTPEKRTFGFASEAGLVEEFTLEKGSGLTRSIAAADGNIISEVIYRNPKKFAKWSKAIPTELTVKNYEYDYEMRFSVAEFSPGLPSSFDDMLLTPGSNQ